MKLVYAAASPYASKCLAVALECGLGDRVEKVAPEPGAPMHGINIKSPLGKLPDQKRYWQKPRQHLRKPIAFDTTFKLHIVIRQIPRKVRIDSNRLNIFMPPGRWEFELAAYARRGDANRLESALLQQDLKVAVGDALYPT